MNKVMGIAQSIKRNCRQTAVYWGNPRDDGFGHFTFEAPVELTPPNNGVRWQNKVQVLGKGDETSVISRAVVFVNQDLDENGLLFLGTLNDLDSAQEAEPHSIPGICIIKRFEKSPALDNTSEYLRKAFLTPWLT